MSRNNYHHMASSFLDLWQEQITRSMSDGDFIRSMLNMMQNAKPHEQKQTNRHTAATSRASDDELDDLRQRLAACEQRIAELEAATARPAPAKPRKKPTPKPSGRTSRTDKPATSRKSTRAATAQKPVKKSTAKANAASSRKVVKRAVKRS